MVELIDLVRSVTIFLFQTILLRWLTFLLGSQTVIVTVLPSQSCSSICSTMAFPPLGNSDHVVVSVSIDFPSNSMIIKLSASAAASEFCEWVQVGIDVYIPHRKYQIKPHSSPWFLAAYAAARVHRNHFFLFVPTE